MSRQPTLAEVIRAHVLSNLSELHVALPGRIESYDAATQQASVQPLIKSPITDEEGERQVERLPVIPGVPVQFPQGGGFRLTFPLAAGDTGLLLFSEVSLDVWLSEGGEVDPRDDRRHHLTDAIFIPGVRSFKTPLSDAHETKLSLGKEAGLQLFISDSKIQLGGESGNQAAALGDALTSHMAAVQVWLGLVATFITGLGFAGGPPPSPPVLASSSVEVKP